MLRSVGSVARGDVFVGRRPELDRLRDSLAEVVAGRGGSVLVEGEPGVGKSSLVAAAVADAETRGCRVLRGSADELVSRFPLRVLMDCLPSEQWSAGDPAIAATERLFGVVDRLCAASPVVWVLDDLQWADPTSLLAWARLTRATDQLPLLLVGVCRTAPQPPELASLRPNSTLIALNPLSEELAADLVAARLHAEPGPELRALARRARGNPLYLCELVDGLLREDRVTIDTGRAELTGEPSGQPLPTSLPAAIADRLGFLSSRTRQVLRTAAMLGTEFSVDDLATVTDRTAEQLRVPLAEAVGAALLVAHGGKLAFRHPLIRQAVHHSVPSGLRVAWHHQIAHSLARAGAPVEDVAEQLLAAPDAIDGWALDWIADHAPTLIRRGPRLAAPLLEHATKRSAANRPRRDRLAASLATVFFLLGEHQRTVPIARTVLARTTDADTVGEMTWMLAYTEHRRGDGAAALASLDAGLRNGRVSPRWRARLRAQRAVALVLRQRFDEGQAAAAEALAEGERLGDGFCLGYAWHALSLLGVFRHDYTGAVESIRRGLTAIGDAPDTLELHQLLLTNRMYFLDEMDRRAEADESMRAMIALADRSGTAQLPANYTDAAKIMYYRGRWDDALATLESVVDHLPDRQSLPGVWRTLLGVRALVAGHRDDRPGFEADLAAAAALPHDPAGYPEGSELVLLAESMAEERAGHPERAEAVLAAALRNDQTQARNQFLRHQWLPTLTRLAMDLGDTDIARAAARACTEGARNDPIAYKSAAADHCHGIATRDAALVLGAADYYRRAQRPLEWGQSLEDAAVLAAEAGDQDAARRFFAEAVDVFAKLGAAWDVMRAEARMRPHGVRRGPRGPRRRPTAGWQALTPTELKVARLVAMGKSNPDVATELFLSRRTVQTHVSHILGKLDVKSRAEIALHAARNPAASD